MIFRISALAAAVILAAVSAHAEPVKAFQTEAAAKRHCPKDEVVYGENKSGGIYHLKGSRYYGHLKDGKYVCRREADAGGWRAATNNQ